MSTRMLITEAHSANPQVIFQLVAEAKRIARGIAIRNKKKSKTGLRTSIPPLLKSASGKAAPTTAIHAIRAKAMIEPRHPFKTRMNFPGSLYQTMTANIPNEASSGSCGRNLIFSSTHMQLSILQRKMAR